MIDEAFMPFHQIVERMISFGGELVDDAAGIRFYIDQCEIDSPVELSIAFDENGVLQIGSTPPMYYADTSFRPSYHRLRFTAQHTEPNIEQNNGD